MSFITELHCHTGEISNCASESSRSIVNRYVEAGYTSLTVTNHLSCHTFGGHKYVGSRSWDDKISFFMKGVDIVKEHAQDRINVLWGIELRLNTDDNDYLVYGVTEDFLRNNPDLLDITLKEAKERLLTINALIFQAHPFRNNMRISSPNYLDGVEAYNGAINHDSRNDIAEIWAKKFGLRMISGSDLHHSNHIISGGISTDTPITNNDQLLEVLRSGNYNALHIGEAPASN